MLFLGMLVPLRFFAENLMKLGCGCGSSLHISKFDCMCLGWNIYVNGISKQLPLQSNTKRYEFIIAASMLYNIILMICRLWVVTCNTSPCPCHLQLAWDPPPGQYICLTLIICGSGHVSSWVNQFCVSCDASWQSSRVVHVLLSVHHPHLYFPSNVIHPPHVVTRLEHLYTSTVYGIDRYNSILGNSHY